MTTEQMFFAAATGTTVLAVSTVDAGSVTLVHAAGELDVDTAGSSAGTWPRPSRRMSPRC